MSNNNINQGRRRFLTKVTGVVGAVGVAGAAIPFVNSWQLNAKGKAAGAPVKVNVGKLEPGQLLTVEWRGKPVYVVRRTDEVLANLESASDQLRDPDSDNSSQPDYIKSSTRSIRPEFLVVEGLCTHLGCTPHYRPKAGVNPATREPDLSWEGGFFCLCHGTAFDLAGRVFQGFPAPTNLVVPPHNYEDDNVLVIGIDQQVA